MSVSKQTKDVFISYHMNSSTDIVEKISAALAGAGISSWYAKQDISGSYAGTIIEAIEQCKVFLLILNEYSSASQHCLNEINAVFERMNRKEDVVILPFKIDKCELSKDAYYYIGRIRIFDGSLPPEVERVAELVDRISNILKRETMVEKWITDGSAKPKHYRLVGSSIAKSTSFVGRRKELAHIHQQMSGHQNKLFLVGMGGIGKSEIARAYCDLYRNDYDVVLWLSFHGSLCKTIANDFLFQIQGMDHSDNPQEDEHTYFLRKLKALREIADRRVLIVLDNFDVLEDEDLKLFCDGAYSVLFTTRYHEVCSDMPEIEICPITDFDELMEMFRMEYHRSLTSDGTKKVSELFVLLEGHPLSIRLVASTMESNRIQPEQMVNIIKKENEGNEKRSKKAVEKIKDRLTKLFQVSSLEEEAQSILKNLVLMPLTGIEVEIFYDWCEFDDFDTIDDLIRKSWVVHQKSADKIHLHPIVREVLADELESDPDCCNLLLNTLTENVKSMAAETFEGKKRYYECFSSCVENLPKNHPLSWDVLYGYAKMVMEMSRYKEGREILLHLFERTNDLNSQLELINRISHSYCLNGDATEGIEWAEKGLFLIKDRSFTELSEEQRTLRGQLYMRLNDANRTLGKFEQCEKYLRMSIEDAEQFSDVDKNHLAWLYLHLARILALKQIPEAYPESTSLMEKCLKIFSEIKSITAVGYTYMFYGMLNMYEGKFDEAFRKISKATELLEKGIGNQHVDIAKLKLFEANIYRMKGDEETAKKIYLQAEEMMLQRGNPRLALKIREVMESGKVGYTN